MFTSGSHTLNPGLYSEILLSGTAQVTLTPGTYVIAGGGLSVSGPAKLSGSGVMIYLAGGTSAISCVAGELSVVAGATVDISAPATGGYAGVAVFQGRNNKTGDVISGGTLNLHGGVFYAAAAELDVSGLSCSASMVNGSLVVDRLMLSGNAGNVVTRYIDA